ncbi:lipoate--protein ligase [Pilibacter termitis]|uniref:lipoate--protein ligase n=1 Tax=Pilibacter termitis TaxID=263852 RepID=UPI001F16CE50|nr:lipoate--protein ligase [Pilibacter termitis]
MRYIVNKNLSAPYNIALDEWLLTSLRPDEAVFALWQNQNAVIVGKHQNTFEEVNEEFVKEHNIEVVRRVTGGGAVYHDLGNLNFTFIIPVATAEQVDWKTFVAPMVVALQKLGIPAEVSGRNDLVVNGKKISGNAQRYANGYLMHHGTLLFNSDIEVMIRSLNVNDEKFISKAVKSVRSRVGNIQEYAPMLTIEEFQRALTHELSRQGVDKEIILTEEQVAQVKRLEREKFSTWDWNYGESPKFNYHAHEKFDGGIVDVKAQVEDGKIFGITFEGDFLGIEDIEDLLPEFIGLPFSEIKIHELLSQHEEKKYFGSIKTEEIAGLFKEN